MHLRGMQRQAKYLRQREIEHQHKERVQAVSRYFDHWDTVTNRFKNWTEPKYYETANKTLAKKKENDIKAQQLVERQKKLRELYNFEEQMYNKAVEAKNRPISSKKKVRLEVLEKVNNNLKEEEMIRRKLDMEAKLYGKWRHGVDDDNLLFESKSDNETLAKLNWIDKKIDDQMQREKDEEAAKERDLRLQIEATKTEKLRKDRQIIRQREMAELRAMQDKNLEELKVRTNEFDMLEEREQIYKQEFIDLEKELELLTSSTIQILEENQNKNSNEQQSYNLKNVKALLRKRNRQFVEQLKLMIDILQRLRCHVTDKKEVEEMLTNYRHEYDENSVDVSRLDAMYESEAKSCLDLLEENWQRELVTRYEEMKKIITDHLINVEEKVRKNDQRQEEVMQLRNLHLSSIEEANKKLKELVLEENDDELQNYEEKQMINSEKSKQNIENTLNATDTQQSFGKTNTFDKQFCDDAYSGELSRTSLGKKLSNVASNRDLTKNDSTQFQRSYVDLAKYSDTAQNQFDNNWSQQKNTDASKSSKPRVIFNDKQNTPRDRSSNQIIRNFSDYCVDPTTSQIKPTQSTIRQTNSSSVFGQPSRQSFGYGTEIPTVKLSDATVSQYPTQTGTETQLIGAQTSTTKQSNDKTIVQSDNKSQPPAANRSNSSLLNATASNSSTNICKSLNERFTNPENLPRSLLPSKTRLTAPYACSSTIPSVLPTRDIPDTLKFTGRRLFPQKHSMTFNTQSKNSMATDGQLSESFRNLNLDVWRGNNNSNVQNKVPLTESQEALVHQKLPSCTAPQNRFRRKRVAWT